MFVKKAIYIFNVKRENSWKVELHRNPSQINLIKEKYYNKDEDKQFDYDIWHFPMLLPK